MSELNNDVSSEEARALHRVVRAMHDGNCPKCGIVVDAHEMRRTSFAKKMWKCPNCSFQILKDEADAAMQAFRPYMLANLEAFEKWRERRRQSVRPAMSDETIEVTLKLPKPPEGCGEVTHRLPNDDDIIWTGKRWHKVEAHELWVNDYFCCRRIDDPWKPPAGAADGLKFYYRTKESEWYVTDCDDGSWSFDLPAATIFRDFVPPPQRRPYTVGKDC